MDNNKTLYKFNFTGSTGWLIFWMIFFFPIALVLFFTSSEFEIDNTNFAIHYNGSRSWLCFWLLFFFPIALYLLFTNGISVEKKEN